MNQLAFSAIHYRAVQNRIRAQDPQIDEQTLADTVEGLTDLHEIVTAIIRSALADEVLATALKCEGFRMPAYDGRHREHRGWGPAFENLQGRKSREGIRRRCGALYGDLAAARGVADGSRWG